MSTIQSMTGFASAQAEMKEKGSGRGVRIEARTLNHRFLDLKLRLPRDLSSQSGPLESLIKPLLQEYFQRGSVEILLDTLESSDSNTREAALEFNSPLAKHYVTALREAQKSLKLPGKVQLDHILSLPDLWKRPSNWTSLPVEELWPIIEPSLRTALKSLQSMRQREGSALVQILKNAISEMKSTLEVIRKKRASSLDHHRQKIRSRIETLFQAHPLPVAIEAATQAVLESRVAQELTLILDRTDIEEEVQRFGKHLDHLNEILSGKGPVGRKIDFLLQELHREINTLGNKAQDFSISEEVVQIKVKLEQLREQVMNLE